MAGWCSNLRSVIIWDRRFDYLPLSHGCSWYLVLFTKKIISTYKSSESSPYLRVELQWSKIWLTPSTLALHSWARIGLSTSSDGSNQSKGQFSIIEDFQEGIFLVWCHASILLPLCRGFCMWILWWLFDWDIEIMRVQESRWHAKII